MSAEWYKVTVERVRLSVLPEQVTINMQVPKEVLISYNHSMAMGLLPATNGDGYIRRCMLEQLAGQVILPAHTYNALVYGWTTEEQLRRQMTEETEHTDGYLVTHIAMIAIGAEPT